MNSKFYFVCLFLLAAINVKAQQIRTNISVHDPVMIRQDSIYYLFGTGKGIAMWSSKDMLNWKQEKQVFAKPPQWAIDSVNGYNGHTWAPDISYYKGQYYLFYSVSTFGKNSSCIGLVTNKTLHTEDSNYHWVDHGKIIQSVSGKTNWNAIDPNLITDDNGKPYLAFGSFWDGLKLVKLNANRLSIAESTDNLPTIASRKKGSLVNADLPLNEGNLVGVWGNAIEAPFITKKLKYYYLFASIDYCCKGVNSTYKMIVGRSKDIIGPYLDKKGISMAKGGGSIVLAGDKNWYGVGHNAVCTFDEIDYLVFHGYDAGDNGKAKLRIEKLTWDKNGWPSLPNN